MMMRQLETFFTHTRLLMGHQGNAKHLLAKEEIVVVSQGSCKFFGSLETFGNQRVNVFLCRYYVDLQMEYIGNTLEKKILYFLYSTHEPSTHYELIRRLVHKY